MRLFVEFPPKGNDGIDIVLSTLIIGPSNTFNMKHKDTIGIVPSQYKGQEIEVDATQDLKTEAEARLFYDIAKKKLLNVNNWSKVAGVISAEFQIVDKNGEEVQREVQQGDYLRIDIPGPGTKEGDGFDWVLVEEIKEIRQPPVQSVGFRVRPTENPFGHKNETAHFYAKEATSSFIIICEKTKLIAWIIDRNLRPNTDQESLADKIRDVTVGLSAIAGFSKVQWQGLADGLVKS